MYAARINRVRQNTTASASLYTAAADIFYLTGLQLTGFWLLITPTSVVAVTPRLLAGQVQAALPGIRVISGDRMVEVAAAYLRRHHVPALAVDASAVTWALVQKLGAHVKVRLQKPLPPAYRQIKDAEEIALLRTSCTIASAAVRYAHGLLKPGITEESIAFKIEEYFARHHVRPSFLPIVASGPHSANPHHTGSARKIEENDTVLIDLGCVYQGYCSDLTRTCFLGKISKVKRSVFALVQQAQQQAVAGVRPQVTAGHIDALARRPIAAAGYGPDFIHTTGHGVGIDIHEEPRISRKNTTILQPGMAITVEPGIYLRGRFGVRIEDTVLVTENGNEVLTS